MTHPPRLKVLIVDDEANLRLVLSKILSKEGYQVIQAPDGAQGLALLARESVDLILCDVRMPVLDGPSFLAEVKKRGLKTPVIMLSAYGTVDSAIEALKAGAFDYVFKPFKPDEILLTIKRAEENQRLKEENLALRRAASKGLSAGIVARSKAMLDLLDLVERVAPVKNPVLITGESGTGKELIARAIHIAGPRKDRPFVPINCGAIPDQLLESELFGHVRGAFTDAVEDRPGMFREAEKGTLFLDEIGELPQSMQVKLLRVLQFEEIRPVGGAGPVKTDVRVLAATARNLPVEVKEGRFREDLFYRLNVLPLTIPPLRERPDDLPPLLDHFLIAGSAHMGRSRPEVAPEALDLLLDYPWPGNVRELENLVDRLLVLHPDNRIEAADLPAQFRTGVSVRNILEESTLDLKAGIRNLEARLISKALKVTNGNRAEAARRLKISYPSLLSKIKTYGLGD